MSDNTLTHHIAQRERDDALGLDEAAELAADIFEGEIVGAGEAQTEEELRAEQDSVDSAQALQILDHIWQPAIRPSIERVETDPAKLRQRQLRGQKHVDFGPFVRIERISHFLAGLDSHQAWMPDEALKELETNPPYDGEDVYISINQFRGRRFATEQDLRVINGMVLELDRDETDTEPTLEAVNEHAVDLEIPRPGLVTDSGGGLHLVWFLKPIWLHYAHGRYSDKAENRIEWYRDVAERLQVAFEDLGADPNQPLSPIQQIRMPGSYNVDHDKQVEALHYDSEQLCRLDHFDPLKKRETDTLSETGTTRASQRQSFIPASSTRQGWKPRTIYEALPPALRDHPAIQEAMGALDSPRRRAGASTLAIALVQGPADLTQDDIYELLRPIVDRYQDAKGKSWGVDGEDRGMLRSIARGCVRHDYGWVEAQACSKLGLPNPETVGVYVRGRGGGRAKVKPANDSTPGPAPAPFDDQAIAKACEDLVAEAAETGKAINYHDIAERAGVSAKQLRRNRRVTNGYHPTPGSLVILQIQLNTRYALVRTQYGFRVLRETRHNPLEMRETQSSPDVGGSLGSTPGGLAGAVESPPWPGPSKIKVFCSSMSGFGAVRLSK